MRARSGLAQSLGVGFGHLCIIEIARKIFALELLMTAPGPTTIATDASSGLELDRVKIIRQERGTLLPRNTPLTQISGDDGDAASSRQTAHSKAYPQAAAGRVLERARG
eukprot:6508817-Pyramimonas_sp.AAC.1